MHIPWIGTAIKTETIYYGRWNIDQPYYTLGVNLSLPSGFPEKYFVKDFLIYARGVSRDNWGAHGGPPPPLLGEGVGYPADEHNIISNQNNTDEDHVIDERT